MENALKKSFRRDVYASCLKSVRFISLLFVFSFFTFASYANSQVARVNLNVTNKSVKDVLMEIEKQTDYLFVYSESEINSTRKISYTTEDATLDEVLVQLFEETNIVPKVQGKNILLMKEARQTTTSSMQQNVTVRGKITDNFGDPLPGVNIVMKGDRQVGAVSDIDGNYGIYVPSANVTLVFTYVGFQPQEVAIAGRTTVDVVLRDDSKALDELVVIGYGTQKKENLTGAVSSVDVEKTLGSRPISDVGRGLQGTIPGLSVSVPSGEVGSDPIMKIRGQVASISGSSNPLILLDNVEIPSIQLVNPNDIESISVLKDAAASSIYGSKAAFGVILITTKKGKNAARINLNITQGVSSRAYKDYDRVNVWDYYPLQWKMLMNSALTAGSTPQDAAQNATNNIVSTLKYNPFANTPDNNVVGVDGRLNPSATSLKWGDDLDWENAAYQTGHRQEYNLSYSSMTDKSDTYASIGYLDDSGYMLKTDFERYSGRINYNIAPRDWVKSGLNLYLSKTQSNYSTSDASSSSSYNNLARFVRVMAPIYPVHKHNLETGQYLDRFGEPTTNPADYIYDYEGNRLSSVGRDAVAETEYNMRDISRVGSTARTYLTLMPIEGLEITANYALENTDLRRKVYENPLVGDGTAGPGRLNITLPLLATVTFL